MPTPRPTIRFSGGILSPSVMWEMFMAEKHQPTTSEDRSKAHHLQQKIATSNLGESQEGNAVNRHGMKNRMIDEREH